MNKVSIFPIMNLPEFDTGHEIVEELIKSLEENKISLEDTDVIVITQKIISKVEGRKIDINKEDIEEVIKNESLQIIRKRGETVIAKTKHGFICANPPVKVKIETVGPPIKGVEVKLSEEGELLVKGEGVMKGYWKQEKETSETIIDGWLHTGDLADIDEDGYITIKDRKKETIVGISIRDG